MHASDRPLVSVCIPTHDDSGVVADALRSALRQAYSPLEILVVDNRSSDGTWEIVKALAADDRRVRTLRNAENIGMARNFSACVRAANGEYVLILCADDVLQDGCVELLATALGEHPEAVLAACGRTFTDPSLRPQRVFRARSSKQEVPSATMLRECFAHGNRIGEPSAVMFRRRAAARGFDADYNQAVDLEMWLHLLGKGSAVLLSEQGCLIRQHPHQATRDNIRSGRVVRDKQLLYRRYAQGISHLLTPLDKLAWDARMASSLARSRMAGGPSDPDALAELFYPKLFRALTNPLVGSAWRLRRLFPG